MEFDSLKERLKKLAGKTDEDIQQECAENTAYCDEEGGASKDHTVNCELASPEQEKCETGEVEYKDGVWVKTINTDAIETAPGAIDTKPDAIETITEQQDTPKPSPASNDTGDAEIFNDKDFRKLEGERKRLAKEICRRSDDVQKTEKDLKDKEAELREIETKLKDCRCQLDLCQAEDELVSARLGVMRAELRVNDIRSQINSNEATKVA